MVLNFCSANSTLVCEVLVLCVCMSSAWNENKYVTLRNVVMTSIHKVPAVKKTSVHWFLCGDEHVAQLRAPWCCSQRAMMQISQLKLQSVNVTSRTVWCHSLVSPDPGQDKELIMQWRRRLRVGCPAPRRCPAQRQHHATICRCWAPYLPSPGCRWPWPWWPRRNSNM